MAAPATSDYRGSHEMTRTALGVLLALSMAACGGAAKDGGQVETGGQTVTSTSQVAPTQAMTTTTKPIATSVATTRSAVSPATTTATATVRYANCTEVRAAGKAPLRRGQPGYTSGTSALDRDGDGIACE